MPDMNDRIAEAVSDSNIWFPDFQHDVPTLPLWLLCLAGESGELFNKAKKFFRGSLTWDEVHPMLADELVDTLVYAYNVAAVLEINLEEEYDKKRSFNDGRFGNSVTD
jgi:NTP pyrophosphatase (non-canonical NTP hydrolase)